MVLYVGYPISYTTACGFFGLAEHDNIEELIKPTGLTFDYTDKGQYILGLEVEGVTCRSGKFLSVDDALIKIMQLKKKVVELVIAAGLDMTSFPLDKMGGEDSERVSSPQPYLIYG
jgi:hypothetical protein